MPRTSTDEDKPKKRAPKKRTVRKTVRKRAPRKTATKTAVRKRASQKGTSTDARPASVERTVDRGEHERPARKAPTPLASRRADGKAKRNQILIVVAIFLVGMGGSAAIGFTDKGQIDVNQAIEERNERLRTGQLREGDTQQVIVPVQNTEANKRPDGGLIGGRPSAPQPPPPEPATTTATSTATSTDATATSTEAQTGDQADPADTTETEEAPTTQPPTDNEGQAAAETTADENVATEEAPTSGP